MALRFALALFAFLTAFGAEKKPFVASAGNLKVSVQAVAYTTKEEIKQVLGSDLGGNIIVVEITITPKAAEPMKIFGDDFLLRSYKDGQKSGPFAPSQIAGKGGLALASVGVSGGGMMSEPTGGPSWGGLGGGMPNRMPGNGGGIGNAGAATVNEATVKDDAKEKANPLLQILKQKGLPEKETAGPLKGLLYFPLEGKHKAKDMALVYQGAGGKLILEFHQ